MATPAFKRDGILVDERDEDDRVAMLTAIEPDTDLVDRPFEEYVVTPVRKREPLGRITRLLSVLRSTNRILVDAQVRNEIETGICETLTEEGPYDVACFGEYTASFGSISVEASRGLDADDLTGRYDVRSDRSIASVVEKDTVVVGSIDDAAPGVEPLFADAGIAPPEWLTVVPVRHRETVYGVLLLGHSGDRDVGPEERSLLAELGDIVANGIASVETRELLAADTVTSLEFEVTDAGDLFVDWSARDGCRFVLEGIAPAAAGSATCYVRATDVDSDAVLEELSTTDGVTHHRVIADRNDTLVLELTIQDGSMILTLSDARARVVDFVAEDGAADVSVVVADGVDVRTVMETVERRYPETSLVAKRTEHPGYESTERFASNLSDELTERQRSTLEAAYNAGYFDWPRGSTAEEVAEAVDLSPPTLHEHLRDAERTLLEIYFDEVAMDNDPVSGSTS